MRRKTFDDEITDRMTFRYLDTVYHDNEKCTKKSCNVCERIIGFTIAFALISFDHNRSFGIFS